MSPGSMRYPRSFHLGIKPPNEFERAVLFVTDAIAGPVQPAVGAVDKTRGGQLRLVQVSPRQTIPADV